MLNVESSAKPPPLGATKQPLPSIGGSQKTPKKPKEAMGNSSGGGGGGGGDRRRSLPTHELHQTDKASTTTADSSIRTNKSAKQSGKKANQHHEWNRYFAFINDKQREKLMQLPDTPNVNRDGGKASRRGARNKKRTDAAEMRSKSAKVETNSRRSMNKRRATTPTRAKSVEFDGRGREAEDDEAAKAKTSTPKAADDDQPDSELEEKRRIRRMQRTKPSLLGNYNFNTDLDNNNNNNAAEKKKKKSGKRVGENKPGVYGYEYFRSETNQRVQCRPHLIDEFDQFTLADEYRTLKFRTTQNNLMRSMRSNLVSFSKMREMNEKFLRCNQNFL